MNIQYTRNRIELCKVLRECKVRDWVNGIGTGLCLLGLLLVLLIAL